MPNAVIERMITWVGPNRDRECVQFRINSFMSNPTCGEGECFVNNKRLRVHDEQYFLLVTEGKGNKNTRKINPIMEANSHFIRLWQLASSNHMT